MDIKFDKATRSIDADQIAEVIIICGIEYEFDFECPASILAERILLATKKPVNFHDIAKFCFDVMRRHSKEGCNADLTYIVNRQLDILAAQLK